MNDKTLAHLTNLQQQIESRAQAMAQFIANLETSCKSEKPGSGGKELRPPVAMAKPLKGVVIKISKTTGECSCHDLDTGERFKC